ncbi:ABC transporter permease [Streptomyces sp. NPDC087845]|uniref:ABC transporter permease n=1 Tax=Streptomyces sp. NPDC087845 TaxID=3365806 RepID=UPI003813D281
MSVPAGARAPLTRSDRLHSAVWTFFIAARTEQRSMRGNPLLLVNAGFLPVVLLIIAVETQQPTADRGAEIVASVMLTALWGSTIWTSGGVLRRERTYGTLARCVCGVESPTLILFGKSLGATLYGVGTILASTVFTVLALRLPVGMAHPFWLVVGLVVVIVSATTLGALLSCLFLLTRNGLIWSGALMYPVFVLGGLLIPQDVLPVWLRWVPQLLSLRWINEFLSSAAGHGLSITPLAVAVLLTVGYGVVAGRTYRWSIDKARQRGTLDYA